jgi:Calcium-dependent channel, 7TM region, putative phosphate/Late exocytosis, associated with Golgi transport/Cytosolic domain of 10TM putative phosphate transporter
MSDQEIIQRIGYDTLIFLRFHRLALRCIIKMSIFSFLVLLPLNYTGGGRANAQDLKGYVESLFLTDFLRFTMANVAGGSPRLWVHCFAAYLLTVIVVRELLVEYETFNSIRHCYLLSREPHLRTVLVTNIPRHLRSPHKISTYFSHVYPNAVKHVAMCQNLLRLEALVAKRTKLLAKIEKELLLLCRKEKARLFERSRFAVSSAAAFRFLGKLEDYGLVNGSQERFTKLYAKLDELNDEIEKEQRRRHRVMRKLDRMEAGEGRKDIDYILASPFVSEHDPNQRRLLGLQQQRQPSNIESAYNPPASEMPTSTTDSQLRARSPRPDDQTQSNRKVVAFEEFPESEGKKAVKAKSAIQRYSRISRDVSFLGRPIRSSAGLDSDGYIEDHINEVTDKAFVVMRTFTAATIAIQSMHSSKPGAMQVAPAPEPRDVLWENIYVSKGATRTRSILGEFLVILIISFYVIPVALVSLLVSESALVSISPRLAQLDQATALFSSAIAMVQPLCIVTLQQLLPPLFMAIGKLEGLVSFSEVQMRAFSRYFLFQVLNVFLVTTIAGSIFDTIAIIVETPEAAFEMLGNSLPRMSSFFISFVTIKTFLGLGMELVRTMSLCQATIRYFLVPNATLRTARSVVAGMRAIDDPGWFPFHKILAQDMLVVVISVVFAVVAPLVLLPCALFCTFSRIMWTHHHLYVYESVFESGGMFFPKIFRRFIFGLIIAQMTITGQFILKEARHEAYATIALMFMTYLFLRSTRARYDPISSTLPLEVATVMDISLTQEEEARRRAREEAERRGENLHPPSTVPSGRSYDTDHRTQTTSSIPDTGATAHDSELGNLIGGHDPFEQAYLQPALRANPRAKPEQPFPPAQLGRDDALFGQQNTGPSNIMSDPSDSAILDSNATVRLKSMSQQDRKLTNRWWEDQMQRCGDQNVFSILMGEECGTLTIGRRATLAEPSAHVGSEHHVIV